MVSDKLYFQDALDKQLIVDFIPESTNDLLEQLTVFDSVSSTNDEILRQGVIDSAKFIVCVADHQSKGRGRNGREWQSPEQSNIYMSFGGCIESDVSDLNGLSLVCGVIVSRLLETYGIAAQLKWPNDILVADKKLAGMLIETRIKAGSIFFVVGLGVNVNMPKLAAKNIDQAWTDMNSELPDGDSLSSRNEIVAQLLSCLIEGVLDFFQSGFSSFEEDWKRLDILSGQKVEVITEQETFMAVVLGLNDDFAIRVDINGEEKIFYAADIKLRLDNHVND